MLKQVTCNFIFALEDPNMSRAQSEDTATNHAESTLSNSNSRGHRKNARIKEVRTVKIRIIEVVAGRSSRDPKLVRISKISNCTSTN